VSVLEQQADRSASDPEAGVDALLRELGTHRDGLSERGAERRLREHGPVFHTAPLSVTDVAILATFPVIVWATDELRRWRLRRPGVRHEALSGS
jgi:hypothetical protein